jgi:hypothetical protein
MKISKMNSKKSNVNKQENCWVSCVLPVEMSMKHFPTFKRRISYAGNSLVLIVPEDLSNFLKLKKGSNVELVPLNSKMFVVKLVD